jgi:hypothetical protein
MDNHLFGARPVGQAALAGSFAAFAASSHVRFPRKWPVLWESTPISAQSPAAGRRRRDHRRGEI